MNKTSFSLADLNPEGIPDRWLGKLVDTKPSDIHLYNPKVSSVSRWLLQLRGNYSAGRTNIINYFVYRHTLSTSSRRSMDIVFCVHYILDHINKSAPASLMEQIRYHWLMHGKYHDEVMYWYLNSSNTNKTNEMFIKLYEEAYIYAYLELKNDNELGYFFHSGPLATR